MAVKDQRILASDLIHIEQRQAVFSTQGGQQLITLSKLAMMIG